MKIAGVKIDRETREKIQRDIDSLFVSQNVPPTQVALIVFNSMIGWLIKELGPINARVYIENIVNTHEREKDE